MGVGGRGKRRMGDGTGGVRNRGGGTEEVMRPYSQPYAWGSQCREGQSGLKPPLKF